MKRLALVSLVVVAAAALAAASLAAPKGPTQVVMWHGFMDYEAKALKAEVDAFNRSHPAIHVNLQFYGNADFALQ